MLLLFVKTIRNSECVDDTENISPFFNYPYHIWTFWTGYQPPTVQFMLRNLSKVFSSPWKFSFLTLDNVSSYLNVTEFIPEFKVMSSQFQSDYLRLKLVESYGGWWIDASTIIKNVSILTDWMAEMWRHSATFFGFCQKQCPLGLIETGVFYAPQGSVVVKAWRIEFERLNQQGALNYIYSTYRSGITFRPRVFDPYPFVSDYFSIFVAMQVALQRRLGRHCGVLIKRAESYIFELVSSCHRKVPCMQQMIQREFYNPQYSITKVTGKQRRITFGDETKDLYKARKELHPLLLGEFSSTLQSCLKWIAYSLLLFTEIINVCWYTFNATAHTKRHCYCSIFRKEQ